MWDVIVFIPEHCLSTYFGVEVKLNLMDPNLCHQLLQFHIFVRSFLYHLLKFLSQHDSNHETTKQFSPYLPIS